MSNLFRTTDFQAADKAAKGMPHLVADAAQSFILEMTVVPILVFFMTHIAEHRRCVKVSSEFFRLAVVREIEQRCIRNNLDADAAKVLIDLVKEEAEKLWKSRQPALLYKTPDSVISSLTEFLKKH